jgi:hypothetical protein
MSELVVGERDIALRQPIEIVDQRRGLFGQLAYGLDTRVSRLGALGDSWDRGSAVRACAWLARVSTARALCRRKLKL